MGLLDWLFGSAASQVHEEMPEPVHLAPGRGFTFEVVGEANCQDTLDAICGASVRTDTGYQSGRNWFSRRTIPTTATRLRFSSTATLLAMFPATWPERCGLPSSP